MFGKKTGREQDPHIFFERKQHKKNLIQLLHNKRLFDYFPHIYQIFETYLDFKDNYLRKIWKKDTSRWSFPFCHT